jgi:ABC-type transporter Mla maintaining outer membrane lipid asymmetry ATPase subunit MlaF
MKTAIHFHRVLKTSGTNRVLRIQDLKVVERECVALYGLSHELVEIITNHITCAYQPEQGTVRIYGKDSRQITESSWFEFVGDFGIYVASAPFLENASIGENLAAMFRGNQAAMQEPKLSAAVLRLANLVQLTITDLSKIMNHASGLLRMKVRLARTVALHPKILILRDPTEGLIPESSRKFADLLKMLRRKLKFTIVLFSSDRWLLQELADRVLFLNPESGVIIENRIRRWYHYVLPFLRPARATLIQLSQNISKHKSGRNTQV